MHTPMQMRIPPWLCSCPHHLLLYAIWRPDLWFAPWYEWAGTEESYRIDKLRAYLRSLRI